VGQGGAEVPLGDDVEQGRAVDPDQGVGVKEGEAPGLGQEVEQAELVEPELAGMGGREDLEVLGAPASRRSTERARAFSPRDSRPTFGVTG
jgi:hypothetical protein